MRIRDALRAVIRKKERGSLIPMETVWTGQADDENRIPLPEYPRPQLKRASWLCLNGWWEYAVTGIREIPQRADGQILVPFSPETSRSGVGRTLYPGQALWYRREIDLSADPGTEHSPAAGIEKGARLLLHFGAVDERCTVWWNRHRLGRHRGGYLPFSFDVTDFLGEGKNELLVRVLDDTDQGPACRGKQKLHPGGMFYTPQSGIWQTVWMEWVPENYVQELKILPHMEEGEVEFRIRMKEPAAGCIKIGGGFSTGSAEQEDRETAGQRTGRIQAGEESSAGSAEQEDRETAGQRTAEKYSSFVSEKDFQKDRSVICRIHLENPVLWSPENPYLYSVKIQMGEDKTESYFAMRSFGTGTDENGNPCLTLNGQPCFFHGVLDQGYWPESLMTAPSDEAMCFDISQMKKLGFNMLRKHAKIEPLRWYYHCDRLGMVVWQDMVNGGGPIPALLCTYAPTGLPIIGRVLSDRHYKLLSREDARERSRFEDELLAMVRHLSNAPCIGMWVIFNEGWGQFDAARLTGLVRREDPSRPIDHASGWFDQKAGDICSVHNYFRDLKVEKDPAGRVFVISEYGGLTCRVPGHISTEGTYGYHAETTETFVPRFHALMEEIRALREKGLAGAVYTQLSDIEEEDNGLLTYDRSVNKGLLHDRIK